MRQGGQLQFTPMTPMVKRLIFINVGIWFVLTVLLSRVLPFSLSLNFGLVPKFVVQKFFV